MRFHFNQRHAEPVVAEDAPANENDKETGVTAKDQPIGSESDGDGEKISPDAQLGVQKMEATTQVWSTSHLITAYVL
jgi:hypothetical protein